MTSLLVVCISAGHHEPAILTWADTWAQPHEVHVLDAITGPEAGYLAKLQAGWDRARDLQADLVAYFHADLFILQHGWDRQLLESFEDPQVAVASFCGARAHGWPDIYKIPYDYRQLARDQFISNMTDAERHGSRVLVPQNVAVVDSFSCIVRRSFLDQLNGWPVGRYPASHCSDYWICLKAHQHHQHVRYLPVGCHHASGGVHLGSFDYPAWAKTTPWGSDEAMHRLGHELIYNDFRDVLPVHVPAQEES